MPCSEMSASERDRHALALHRLNLDRAQRRHQPPPARPLSSPRPASHGPLLRWDSGRRAGEPEFQGRAGFVRQLVFRLEGALAVDPRPTACHRSDLLVSPSNRYPHDATPERAQGIGATVGSADCRGGR